MSELHIKNNVYGIKNNLCIICGSELTERILLNVSNEKDTYLEYLSIDYLSDSLPRFYTSCTNCSNISRSVRLTPTTMTDLYEKFRDLELRGESRKEYWERITNYPRETSENFEKVKFLEQFVNLKSSKVLDIGCGLGVLLNSLAVVGGCPVGNLTGVEPTPDTNRFCSDRGIRIDEKYLNLGEPYEEKYDLVMAVHVIEHVPDHREFIAICKENCSNNGYIYLECPSSLDIGHLPLDHDRFMCQHEVIFSIDGLIKLVKDAGLVVEHASVFLSRRNRFNNRILARLN